MIASLLLMATSNPCMSCLFRMSSQCTAYNLTLLLHGMIASSIQVCPDLKSELAMCARAAEASKYVTEMSCALLQTKDGVQGDLVGATGYSACCRCHGHQDASRDGRLIGCMHTEKR